MMRTTISKFWCRKPCVGRSLLAFGIVALLTSMANACPTCTEGLAQHDPHGQSIAAGYYYSILFMMSMPYIVLGTFISVAYYSIRRAKVANLAAADCQTEPPELARSTDIAVY